MDKKNFEPRKKHSIIEKLRMIKEMDQRNKERRLAFVEQEKRERNEKLFDLYVNGIISREEFESKYKK